MCSSLTLHGFGVSALLIRYTAPMMRIVAIIFFVRLLIFPTSRPTLELRQQAPAIRQEVKGSQRTPKVGGNHVGIVSGIKIHATVATNAF